MKLRLNDNQYCPNGSNTLGRSFARGSALATMILAVGLATPSGAMAKGRHDHDSSYYGHYDDHRGHHKHHKPRKHYYKKHHHHHHRDVVVIRERPRYEHYHRSSLPELVTFAVIAGATYAINDNHYYKQRGDNYDYVPRPR
ncbi:hypothetical protein [Vibrio japonicus]|uniref:Uncharacterized protein n=1 Tax=Vibrio japonicus TaxID=1824638 RepID=A0ABY5LL91_9VIBR|nr:hypothetical protein [Vibrio japonicus]UUM31900.1 hypothetical protein NP165_16490 [Vibrio japonicus]